MTTDAQHDSVTFLTYGQLVDALVASCAEYETRFTAFSIAADRAETAAVRLDGYPEARAEMTGAWEACQAQAAMTSALIAEIDARLQRGDYA